MCDHCAGPAEVTRKHTLTSRDENLCFILPVWWSMDLQKHSCSVGGSLKFCRRFDWERDVCGAGLLFVFDGLRSRSIYNSKLTVVLIFSLNAIGYYASGIFDSCCRSGFI